MFDQRHNACPTHCCQLCGCKYNYPDCPVMTRQELGLTGKCETCNLHFGEAEDTRVRPARRINTLRLTLERGDGECIDLGELPDLKNPIAIAKFLVRLHEAQSTAGRYMIPDSHWTVPQLEFHVTSPAGVREHD